MEFTSTAKADRYKGNIDLVGADLVALIKELQDAINDLEDRIETLEGAE